MTAAYYPRGLYRSRKGDIFGVCKGIAEWKDLPVGPIRLAVILLAVFTGFAPVIVIYILAALVMPVEPRASEHHSRDHAGARYKEHASRTVNDLKREFDNLKAKVTGMESTVFDSECDTEKVWEEKFRSRS